MKFILLTGLLLFCMTSCRVVHPHPHPHPHPNPKVIKPKVVLPQKRNYGYYPNKQVYYSPSRHLYFWRVGNHWKSGKHLPHNIKIHGASKVNLSLVSDHPHHHHAITKIKHPVVIKTKHHDKHKGHEKGKHKGHEKNKHKGHKHK